MLSLIEHFIHDNQVSQNFVKAVTLRDVHWHPFDSRVVTSGLNGSLTCWGYRRNQTKRKPLLFTRRHSSHITPPMTSATASSSSRMTASGSNSENDENVIDHEDDDTDDEQARYYSSESGNLQYRIRLNRAGFSYRVSIIHLSKAVNSSIDDHEVVAFSSSAD